MEATNVIRKVEMRPIGDKVIVQPVKPDKISKGGIVIPDSAKRPPLMGIVLAAGPGHAVENPVPAWLSKCFHVFFYWLDRLSQHQASLPFKGLVPKYDSIIPNPVKAGDKVLFHRFSGTEIIDNDDDQVIIMTSDDILAVLEVGEKHCVCTVHPQAPIGNQD